MWWHYLDRTLHEMVQSPSHELYVQWLWKNEAKPDNETVVCGSTCYVYPCHQDMAHLAANI